MTVGEPNLAIANLNAGGFAKTLLHELRAPLPFLFLSLAVRGKYDSRQDGERQGDRAKPDQRNETPSGRKVPELPGRVGPRTKLYKQRWPLSNGRSQSIGRHDPGGPKPANLAS